MNETKRHLENKTERMFYIKNKVIRTITAILMALTMAILCMPASLAAQVNGNCGENINWIFDDATGTLKISGSGTIDLYTLDDEGEIQGENPFEAFYGEIKTVEIEEGVTGIGSYVFANCPKVTEFVLPESIVDIGDGAFENCDSLKVIHLPAVESLGWAIFHDCDSLQNVFFAEGTPYIPMATFKGCENLQEIYIPKSVESVDESAFEEGVTLRILYAGDFKTLNKVIKPVTDLNLHSGMVIDDNVALEYITYNEDGTFNAVVEPYTAPEKNGPDVITIVIIASAAVVVLAVVATLIVIKKKKASAKTEKEEDRNKEYLTY